MQTMSYYNSYYRDLECRDRRKNNKIEIQSELDIRTLKIVTLEDMIHVSRSVRNDEQFRTEMCLYNSNHHTTI